MPKPTYETALIVGAGRGLSASLARLFASEGLRLALAARDTEKLAPLCAETGAKAFACDAVEPDQVARLFAAVEGAIGAPEIVVYNASARARGPVAELVPAEVERAIMVSAFGGFLVAREAAAAWCRRHTARSCSPGHRRASRAIRSRRRSRWASSRCAALPRAWRASSPRKGIHVAHFVIDGAIRNPGRVEPPDRPDSMLDPDAIAVCYRNVLHQPRCAWTWEIELRPWVERF